MSRKQYAFLVVLVAASGLVGGIVSHWLFMTRTAYAQNQFPPSLQYWPPDSLKNEVSRWYKSAFSGSHKVIIAREFRLVDERGQIRGRLYVDKKGHGQLDLLPMARGMNE